LVIVITFDNTY